MPSGLLLAFPLESVAVRLALALGVALIMLRVLSSWNLRSPRARSVLAVSPFVVAVTIILMSSRDLGLPSLLVPSGSGAGSLALPVADRYLDFAPMAPVLVALWAAVSLTLILVRIARSIVHRRAVLSAAEPADPRIAALVLHLARRLDVAPPRVLLVEQSVGGAAVLGVRDPVILLDRHTLDLLDAEELEGVLAHELAHVARRDNLVAWAVAVIRDVSFFVPGASWAVRALHRERESAADLDAVAVTGRPAALASGLLRVVEHASSARRLPHGCAALLPSSAVVGRVHLLLSDDRATPREHRLEIALAAAVSLVAVAAAVALPAQISGEGQRDALGVLVGGSAPSTVAASDGSSAESRVFSVYRSVGPAFDESARTVAGANVRSVDLNGPEDRPGMAHACAVDAPTCVTQIGAPGLTLRPAPIVLLDEPVSARWQATPVSEGAVGTRLGVYWLTRLDLSPNGR